jgi:hypothetical protein
MISETVHFVDSTQLPSTWKTAPRGWGHPLHKLSQYIGQFPPSLAHCFIRQFTQEGDIVFDSFSGGGTTPLEALLLNRVAYGNDAVRGCLSKRHGDFVRPALFHCVLFVERLEEFSQRNVERVGDAQQILDADVCLAPLDTTDERVVQIARQLSQFLLRRDAARLAQCAHALANQKFHVLVRRPRHAPFVSNTSHRLRQHISRTTVLEPKTGIRSENESSQQETAPATN